MVNPGKKLYLNVEKSFTMSERKKERKSFIVVNANVSSVQYGLHGDMPIPPPPPPAFPANRIDTEEQALSSMLLSWYMSGYYAGLYQGLKR